MLLTPAITSPQASHLAQATPSIARAASFLLHSSLTQLLGIIAWRRCISHTKELDVEVARLAACVQQQLKTSIAMLSIPRITSFAPNSPSQGSNEDCCGKHFLGQQSPLS